MAKPDAVIVLSSSLIIIYLASFFFNRISSVPIILNLWFFAYLGIAQPHLVVTDNLLFVCISNESRISLLHYIHDMHESFMLVLLFLPSESARVITNQSGSI